MGELYFIFFGVGILIFAGIVAYSVLQQRKPQSTKSEDYVDPLLVELEQSKAKNYDADDSVSNESKALENNHEAALNSLMNDENVPKIKSELIESFDEHHDSDSSDISEIESNLDAESVDVSIDNTELISNAETDVSTNNKESKVIDNEPQQQRATVHEAGMAPKPQFDKKSSSVVTELVARIKNDDAIEQQGLLSIFRKHDFKFHRKINIFGLNQLTDLWRDIEFELPAARFTELGISIQLADRDGAMSQKELHDFQQMVLEFTTFYDAPDIESCARDLMMSKDKNGIFMKTIGSKNNISVLFRLACTDDTGRFGLNSVASTTVHDLVVYMNVPSTKDPESVFQEMVNDANSLATWLEGKVVDRNGKMMTQRSYSILMQQVSDIAFSMQQDGFTPGDAVAKKLF